MRSELKLGAGVMLAIALLIGGCRTSSVQEPLASRARHNNPQPQVEFWHALAERPLVSNDEAFHALLLYFDGRDDANSYEQRVDELKSRGMLPNNFSRPENQALQRGTLAVALAKALNIRGGLTMTILGPTPRYATRELEYRGIYPASSPNQLFTGAEFTGIIGRVHDFRTGDITQMPAALMPSEMQRGKELQIPRAADIVADATDELNTPLIKPYFAMMIAQDLTLDPLPPATAATTQAAEPFRIVITGVEGMASVRMEENAPWQPAAKGMELNERSEIRTGAQGTVQIVITPDQIVSVDRMTSVKLLRILRQGANVTTDIGIKYGRTRYDLEAGGLEHQSTLRSPNATLAVRGTRVSLYDQRPFVPQAISLVGRAEFQAMRRQAIAFGSRTPGRTRITAAASTPAEVALADTLVDPSLSGSARTEAESALMATVISRGSTVTLDRESGIKIVRGGISPTNAELLSVLPGQLNFVLRWTGDTNMDFGVSSPSTPFAEGGEFVYPASGLDISPGGGATAFDHRAGPSGGFEVAYWNGDITTGVYALGGRNIGEQTAVATIDAFFNGQPVDLFDGLAVSQTVTKTVAPGDTTLALASVGSPFPFGLMSTGAQPQELRQFYAPAPESIRKITPVVVKSSSRSK